VVSAVTYSPFLSTGNNFMGLTVQTAAFTIGMLYQIDTSQATTQALCVTPTRELAIQIVEKAIRPLSANLSPALNVHLAVSQSDKPRHVVPHIVVGTPGKVVDLLKRRVIVATHMKVFVLDEADAMVEAGSGHRANSLLLRKQMPPPCQLLFFSATFGAAVLPFSSKIMSASTRPVDQILIADGPESLVSVSY
jgi:ATP-dependent RNA helicase DDX19/DBP5